jgi:lipoprotein-anchoring transpeptidase ErfK/SrfK
VVPSVVPSVATPALPSAAAPDTLVDPTRVVPDDRPRADMRLEVDVNARRLHVYQGQARVATHPVAVGTAQWPTRTGEWVVSQVVWNPEWVPPRDESWTEDREGRAPGAPDNPLGRAQLIYDPPRTIHGTNRPASVGQAVSHGSIRMTNAAVTRLARQVMEAAGVGKDDAWYRRVRENRGEKVIVDLPRVVPIRVQ